MEKRKVFKISIIDKEISRTEFDRNTFYTSDSELTLVFKLIEKDYSYDRGEILLYNENDESFVTRPITKEENDFVYELDLDIIPHYGKWKAQLQLVKDGDVYTSKPFDFSIVNDLSNLAPQPTLTDINNWSTLKQSANELIDEMKDIIVDVKRVESERVSNENYRKNSESERVSKENERKQAESKRVNQENKRKKTESERENNENKRRIAEFERVDKENTRQQAENQRQSTFEMNESERKNTFETAEQERQSAELIRIENENQRILTYDNLQETIDLIGKVKIDNLAKNSNFANGIGVWRDYLNRMVITQQDGYIEMTVNNRSARLEYTIADKPNDKWFMIGKIKSTSNEAGLGSSIERLIPYTNINEWQTISGYRNPRHGSFSIITNEVGSTTQVEYAMLFNVTSIFGKGNEPTKEIMDWIISQNGYFDELNLRRDDIQQYEINQLRKAIIALGGTI